MTPEGRLLQDYHQVPEIHTGRSKQHPVLMRQTPKKRNIPLFGQVEEQKQRHTTSQGHQPDSNPERHLQPREEHQAGGLRLPKANSTQNLHLGEHHDRGRTQRQLHPVQPQRQRTRTLRLKRPHTTTGPRQTTQQRKYHQHHEPENTKSLPAPTKPRRIGESNDTIALESG